MAAPWTRLAAAGLALLALAGWARPGAAQTAPTLPSMKFLTAPLVSPTAAELFYGAGTTHTSSFAGLPALQGTPPEIVETARALKKDPDLIYEFVHNQVEVEYAFGLRKGALGALIDRSGTPFDQNALFVALAREAGYKAQYRIGKVTMTAADFAAWTGVSDIQAACRLLSSGGTPAAFNGATASPPDCSQTGTFTSVTLLHAWARVKIGGTWYAYDPSFKAHAGPPPVNLAIASGLVAGQAAAAACPASPPGSCVKGTQSGAPYLYNASEPALDAWLQARGTQLLGYLKANAAAQDTDTVVGAAKIVPAYAPAGGWRNTTLAGYAADTTIDGDIPDQYRAALTVTVSALVDGVNSTDLLNARLFVDDIDGRRLGVASNFLMGQFVNGFATSNIVLPPQAYTLMVDDVAVRSYSCTPTAGTVPEAYPCPLGQGGAITLAATHPYAANGGAYGAQTVIKRISTLSAPVAIISGWGSVSPALLAKWSAELKEDSALPLNGSPPALCGGDVCWPTYQASSGDFSRQKAAAGWLAQVSRMLALQARVGDAVSDHQHSIGVVAWQAQFENFQYPAFPAPASRTYYGIVDEYTQLNVDTSVSITSRAGDLGRTDAVVRSVALSAATLEGSLLKQTEDLPDTASTASRFAWGDQPDDEDPCFAANTPRRFYDFTGSTASNRSSLYQYEGSSGGCGAPPATPPYGPANWSQFLEGGLSAYLASGFKVTAPGETFLGPGARFGSGIGQSVCHGVPPVCVPAITTNHPSQQRGGALIATRRDAGGRVVEVAHALTGLFGVTKGGGGKSVDQFAEFDPGKAADVLKDRFVDRSVALGVDLKTGAVGYTTPTLLSVGTGPAPYGLDFALAFKAGDPGCGGRFGPCTGPVQGGWSHAWDIRLSNSGSGLEAMGATSPYAAAGTLAAFLAMQDIFADAARGDLEKDVFAALAADWWRGQMVANVALATRGFSGRPYVRLVDGTWLAPIGAPGDFTQAGARAKVRDTCSPHPPPATILATARRWDISGVSFSLRGAGGDTLGFADWSRAYDDQNPCSVAYGYRPTAWSWPQGPSLSFAYDFQRGVTSVTSSLGRSLAFGRAANNPAALQATATTSAGTLTAGQQTDAAGAISGIADAAGEAWAFGYTPALARSATQRPIPYGQLARVFEPVDPTWPALQYGYDSRGLVSSASDATALGWKTHGPYAWFIAQGGRGERDDPAGGAYTVYYDTDGNAVRDIDEVGRETDSAWDGRHRVVSRTYPETGQDQFAYDAADNVVKLTRVAKAGSGLADLVVRATWNPIWNKLSSITDPMGNRTDFSYYPSGNGASLMSQAQRPAVGGVRPTFTWQYNAIGLVTRSVDPTGVTTTHGYDGLGDLTSTTEGAAPVGPNPALNLTTVFAPDPVGNVVTVTDPRGNATTTQYDAMRRKVGEQNRDGAAGALPLMAKAFVHDANGRLTKERRATAFDGSGNVTAWQDWLTSYTPTGKVAVSTDPLGNETRTLYDALDRPSQVTDASGRVTGRTYDLAGQELTEVRGIGSPLQQNTATFTWWPDGRKRSVKDADNNRINLAYDGFNRLSSITHPDGTTELSQYDPDGDLTIWTNRGGFSIVRCYDVLNRKISEEGRTGAANTGACPTGGTVNLTARPWDIPPRTFAYDLAGRLIDAAIPNYDLAWAYDAAGRPTGRGGSWSTHYGWDGAGNMTGVTYTDGSTFTYRYDALNRTTAALQGSTTLASLGYDPLGRRTVLTFGDGSTQAWDYDGADRVMRLRHVFPTTTSDNLTLGFEYDPADREVTRTASNGAYAYAPPMGSTAYGAANARNQYPSVAGYPYSWWPEGPLMQDDKQLGQYNELGKLTQPLITLTPGVTDPNNLEYIALDALDHVYAHSHQSVAGQSYPFIYHSTDGLRPETVVEWQFVGLGGAPTTQQGVRRYVLGPDPDERWAFLDFDPQNSIYYPHTDRDGTTIALSKAGTAAAKFRYGAYGESSDATTDTGPGPSSYPYRYTGQRLDPNTGLYDYKARDYSPALGRFLQPDPAGLEQGPNLYEYVGGDPVNASDPTGLAQGACTGNLVSGPCASSANIVKRSGNVEAGTTQNGPGALPAGGQRAGGAAAIMSAARKIAVGEEIAGGGPEDPAADVLALGTLAVGGVLASVHTDSDQATTAAVHGNSLQSQRQTYVYQLISRRTGTLLKYGITSNVVATRRYTNAHYERIDAAMQVLTTYSNRLLARLDELGRNATYFSEYGSFPPLTFVP